MTGPLWSWNGRSTDELKKAFGKWFLVQPASVELIRLKYLYETCQSRHYRIPYITPVGGGRSPGYIQ